MKTGSAPALAGVGPYAILATRPKYGRT